MFIVFFISSVLLGAVACAGISYIFHVHGGSWMGTLQHATVARRR
jgi:hypothetical protein